MISASYSSCSHIILCPWMWWVPWLASNQQVMECMRGHVHWYVTQDCNIHLTDSPLSLLALMKQVATLRAALSREMHSRNWGSSSTDRQKETGALSPASHKELNSARNHVDCSPSWSKTAALANIVIVAFRWDPGTEDSMNPCLDPCLIHRNHEVINVCCSKMLNLL